MAQLRYIEDAITLALDESLCNGCGLCVAVCPRAVFAMRDRRAALIDRGACLECGACALNCEPGAIKVDSNVGCASAMIMGALLRGKETACCG